MGATTEKVATPEADAKAADEWLNKELNLIWLVAERCLRQFQRAKLRPQPDHPSLAEIEAIFAARKAARQGGRGRTKSQISSEEELTKEIESLRPEAEAARGKAPIGRIANTLGLRPMELQVFLTVVAPHFDPPLVDVFSVLRGGQQRRGVDLALIAQMLRLKRPDRIAMLDVLDVERPLVRWRLLQLSPPETPEAFGSAYNRVIQPNLETLAVLVGRGELASPLQRVAEIRTAPPNLDDLEITKSQRERFEAMCATAAAAAANGELGKLPWPILFGGRGAGKREIAARIAARAGCPLLTFDLLSVGGGDNNLRDELMRRAEREAMLRGAVLYVGPLAGDVLNEGGKDLSQRLDDYPGLIVLGVDSLKQPRLKFDRAQELEIGLPDKPQRQRLFERSIPEATRAKDLNIDLLANAFHLTPGEIIDTCEEACALAKVRIGESVVTTADLRSGIERRLRNELGEFARRVRTTTTWDDLVLDEDQLDRVKEFVGRMKHADRVYRQWGFGRRLERGKGMIALFSGPPGTGKTMLAGLIANDLGLDMYQVDLAQVVSKWVGETEKQLAKVFDQAERAHAVLLFDEADSLFAKRTEVKSSNDRYGNLAVNYLLQRLESYTGVVVMTTNKDAQLDEGLQRRLNLHLRMDVPKQPERLRLWNSLMPGDAPRASDVDFTQLSHEFEMTGGYIKNAVVRAAFLAAEAGSPITQKLLTHAAALELEDVGRVVLRYGTFATAADDNAEAQKPDPAMLVGGP